MLDAMQQHPYPHYLSDAFPVAHDIERFTSYLERLETAGGDYVMRQCDLCRGLYFIEQGKVTVQLDAEDDAPVRLRAMDAGTIAGEMGLYLGSSASAPVITDLPAVMYRLSPESLKNMVRKNPELATVFHNHIVRLLGECPAHTNRSFRAMAG